MEYAPSGGVACVTWHACYVTGMGEPSVAPSSKKPTHKRNTTGLRPAWTRETAPKGKPDVARLKAGRAKHEALTRAVRALLDGAAASDVAQTLVSIATDRDHPRCVDAIELVWNRMEGLIPRADAASQSGLPSIVLEVARARLDATSHAQVVDVQHVTTTNEDVKREE